MARVASQVEPAIRGTPSSGIRSITCTPIDDWLLTPRGATLDGVWVAMSPLRRDAPPGT